MVAGVSFKDLANGRRGLVYEPLGHENGHEILGSLPEHDGAATQRAPVIFDAILREVLSSKGLLERTLARHVTANLPGVFRLCTGFSPEDSGAAGLAAKIEVYHLRIVK